MSAPEPTDIYALIRAEELHQVAKGRTPAKDDSRSRDDWISCLRVVIGFGHVSVSDQRWRRVWVKTACLAVMVLRSIDRKQQAGRAGQVEPFPADETDGPIVGRVLLCPPGAAIEATDLVLSPADRRVLSLEEKEGGAP